MGNSDGESETVDDTAQHATQPGFTTHTDTEGEALDAALAQDARSALNPSRFEDMHNDRAKYETKGPERCRLQNERNTPRSDATPDEWAAFHQKYAHRGTFDPTTLTRRP